MRIYARAVLGALMLVAFAGPATVRSESLKGTAAESDQSRRSDERENREMRRFGRDPHATRWPSQILPDV